MSDCWQQIQAVTPHTPKILLYGPPGTGKTTFGCNRGKHYSVTLTEDTPAAELRGHYIPHGDHFEWHDGCATKAWDEGCGLVINEINRGGGDVLTHLFSVLDDPAVAELTLPTGKTIRPKEGFWVVATMNGDPSDLPEALSDRFPVRILVDQVHPKALASLSSHLQKMAKTTVTHPVPSERITFRQWKAFDDLAKVISDEMAALVVFKDRANSLLPTIRVAAS